MPLRANGTGSPAPRGPGARRARVDPVVLGPTAAPGAALPPDTIFQGTVIDFGPKGDSTAPLLRVYSGRSHAERSVCEVEGRARRLSVGRG